MTVIGLLTCFDIVIRFRGTSCIFIQGGFLHNALCAHQLHRSVMPQCTPTISQPISWTFVLHWKPENSRLLLDVFPTIWFASLVIACACTTGHCGWIHDLNMLSCLANLSKEHWPSVYSAVTLQALKWINDPEVVSSYTGVEDTADVSLSEALNLNCVT